MTTTWQITIRLQGRQPDGRRHFPFTQCHTLTDLADLPAIVAAIDAVDVCYLLVVPIGGKLDQWRKA